MFRAALLVLCVLALGISCEYVDLPYSFSTTYAPTKTASWVIGGNGDFGIDGELLNVINPATNLFSATIEGNTFSPGNAFRTGTVFETNSRTYADQTTFGVAWTVDASIYIVTHSPIARYILRFTPSEQVIVPPETLSKRDVTNFDVTFSSPQIFPAEWDIILTSSGDNVLSTGDNWVILQEDPQPSFPEVDPTGFTLIYFYQPVAGTDKPITINFSATDLTFSFSVPVEVESEETQVLMFFVEFADNLNQLISGISKYDQTFDFPPLLLADIPKDELHRITNFEFVDPVNGVPLPATFTNLCKISSEIRDRSSARHPTKKHYFQQPWFC